MKKNRPLKLFFEINNILIVSFIFYVIPGISGFSYYMDVYDFIIYFSLSIIIINIASLILSIALHFTILPIENIIKKRNIYDTTFHLVKDVGRGINISLFLVVFERITISQRWLTHSLHISEIDRFIIEVSSAFIIIALTFYLRLKSRRKAHTEPVTTHDDRTTINRRVFVTTAATAAAATAVGSNILFQKSFPAAKGIAAPRSNNILLVTFDTLTSEDMSLYGYKLPTTPNIDRFSSQADVYENFYSVSTFTTPSIATILTGKYPSQSQVYHLSGALRGHNAEQTLPAVLKAAGYNTASIFGNPFAMRLMGSTRGAFDHLSEGPRTDWMGFTPAEVMALPGAADLYNMSQRAQAAAGLVLPPFQQPRSDTPPGATFDAALASLSSLKGPFFMWVHIMAPHAPYLPSPEFRHKFLKPGTHESRQDMLHPHIKDKTKSPAEIKADIQMVRLRYNEWLLEADAAFGSFMSHLEQSGLLDNTATVISSDHGEFFTDTDFGHGGDTFMRPLIHIPMVVKQPGQSVGRRIKAFADHTAIAPTVLDLAGLPIPDWMQGRPLDNKLTTASGMAVTQYLELNSAFGEISSGTLGAVFDQYQYIRRLDTGAEALYALKGTNQHLSTITNDNGHIVSEISDRLRLKFPELYF